MPRSPQNNELIRAARRDEIFRAAGRVFAKKGFAATKIADIAAEAGLSHGLLYHYFTSKEAVYGALFEEIMRRRPMREEVTRGARSAYERVERIIAMWLEKTRERPELSILIAQAFLGDTFPNATRDDFMAHSKEIFELMIADIAEAQRDGDVTRDAPAEELALTLFATVRGLAVIRFAFSAVRADQPMPRAETVLRVLRPGPDEAPASRVSLRPANGAHPSGRRAAAAPTSRSAPAKAQARSRDQAKKAKESSRAARA